MKNLLILLSFIFALFGCAQGAGVRLSPPTLPSLVPTVDVDLLIPPTTIDTPKPDPHAVRFADIPVVGSALCSSPKNDKCMDIPTGILVDEVTYAQTIADAAAVQRLRIEARMLRNLRTQERAGMTNMEKAYQGQLQISKQDQLKIAGDRDKLQHWQPWVFTGGWLLGAIVGGLVVSWAR